MSDLATKALNHLLAEFDRHTNPRVVHTGALKFSVVADLYHDCDRAPSYSTEDTVLGQLTRGEAEALKNLLKDQEIARLEARKKRMARA